MRVLTWNVFHGRAVPPAGRDLFEDFAATIAAWEWDVALLQEVPPWWPVPLGRRCAASSRMCLTHRNLLPAIQHPLARLLPDLLKSSGGGCNAILVRGARILEHRKQELTRRPLRRWVHAVRLDDGTWAGNLHASKQEPRERTIADVQRAGEALAAWSAGAPRALLGGDFNIGEPKVPGLEKIGGGGVDFVYGRGFDRVSGEKLDAGSLSDHAPLRFGVSPRG